MVKRFECLRFLASVVTNDIVVTGVGGSHHEWTSIHPSDGNFYVTGMGYVASCALGISLGLPNRRVIAMDGDGSLLLGVGVLATIGWKKPSNLIVLVFDNECYESPGGLPTATAVSTDLVALGKATEIDSAKASTLKEFKECVERAFATPGPHLINVKIEGGTLQVPTSSVDGLEEKYRFVRHIENSEGRQILSAPTLSPRAKKVSEPNAIES